MNLEELETRLRSLVEVQLLGSLPGRAIEGAVVHKIAAALQEELYRSDDGNKAVPDVFTLSVHPSLITYLQDPQLLQTLGESIRTLAWEFGLRLNAAPTITLKADPSLPLNDVNVIASHRIDSMEETNNMQSKPDEEFPDDNAIPESAFLIIEGIKVFPLRLPVINIGRRLDNTLVIDDPRISRSHAQLRAINGRYVLFDLNSTGGTFINGQRTSQSVLYPGDVISLAGLALIFGQDNPPPRPDLADTSPFGGPGDRPTAILGTMPPAKKKSSQ